MVGHVFGGISSIHDDIATFNDQVVIKSWVVFLLSCFAHAAGEILLVEIKKSGMD